MQSQSPIAQGLILTAVFHFLHKRRVSPAPGSCLCATSSNRPVANCLIAATVFHTVLNTLSVSQRQICSIFCQWLAFSWPQEHHSLFCVTPPLLSLCPAPAHGLIAYRLTATARFPLCTTMLSLSSHSPPGFTLCCPYSFSPMSHHTVWLNFGPYCPHYPDK